MNTSIYNNYYYYKVKTVQDYSILLSKILGIDKNKLWHKKKDIESSLSYIVKDYFSKYSYDSNQVNSVVRCFINDKEIFKYNIQRELYSVLNYFIGNKRAFEIPAYEREIVLVAVILHIANNLDIATSPYKINKNNYKTILIGYLEKFNKISYINLIDDGKKNSTILLETIKTNVRKERRIFELLSANNSFNKYISISSDKKFFLPSYNYSVPGLNKIDKGAAEFVYNNEKIDAKFTNICMDLVLTSMMKGLSVRKFNRYFFIPLKKEYLLDDANLKTLSILNNNNLVNKNFKVLVNYDDAILCSSKLKKYNLDYYVYFSKGVSLSEIDDGCTNGRYLFSCDFYETNKNYVDELIQKNLKVIIERFNGIVTDQELVKE